MQDSTRDHASFITVAVQPLMSADLVHGPSYSNEQAGNLGVRVRLACGGAA